MPLSLDPDVLLAPEIVEAIARDRFGDLERFTDATAQRLTGAQVRGLDGLPRSRAWLRNGSGAAVR
jgi:hypothetical protein